MSTIHLLDITTEHCPMTFVKTKLKLESIPAGDILEVRLKKGEPLDNVPKTVIEQGYLVLSIDEIETDVFKVVVQK